MCISRIADWTMQHEKREAMKICCEAGVPAGAVMDCDDITKDEYLHKRGVLVDIETRDHGTLRIPGFMPKLSENHIEYKTSPALGDGNIEAFKGIVGLSDAEYEELKEKKII